MQDRNVQNTVMKSENAFAPFARILNALALPALVFVAIGGSNVIARPTLRALAALLILWTVRRLYVALRDDGNPERPAYRYLTLKVLVWLGVAAAINGALRAFS